MPRAPFIYLLVLACMNAMIGLGGSLLGRALHPAYRELLGAEGLPAITILALRVPTAFYLLALFLLTLAVFAKNHQTPLSPLWAASAAVVGLDILLLGFVTLGLVMPFFTLSIKL